MSNWNNLLTWVANQKAPSGAPSGYTAYVATITSGDEWNFIQNSVTNGKDSSYYVSQQRASRNLFTYTSGPESDMPQYDIVTGECNTFCLWAPGKPDNLQANSVYYSSSDKAFSSDLFNTDYSPIRVLIEWGPSGDLYVAPAPTAGGPADITNLISFNQATLTVTMTPPGGSPVTIPWVRKSTTSVTATFPSGSGLNSITITDGTKTYTNTIYRYQSPWIEMVYPSYASGSTLTMTGKNFGASNTDLRISLGSLAKPCGNINIITKHTLFTCTLPYEATPTVPIFPIVSQQSTSDSFSSSIIAIYDKFNMRALKLHSAPIGWFQCIYQLTSSVGYQVNSYPGYMTVPSSFSQVDMVRKVFPMSLANRFHVGITGQGSAAEMNNQGGPFDRTQVVSNTKVCDASKLVYCTPPFTGGLASGVYSSYDYSKDLYYANPNGNNYGCAFQYGVNPTTNDTTTKRVPTRGGTFNVTMPTGTGFLLTNRTLVVGGKVIPSTFILFPSVLQVTTGPGTGNTRPSSIIFESYSMTIPSVGFIAPTANKITSLPTRGGPVVIMGDNFGTDASLITVTIGKKPCTSVTIVSPHTTISCNGPPGVGMFVTVNVNVDGQDQSNHLSTKYDAPAIESAYHFGLTLTVVGTNLGNLPSDAAFHYPTDATIISLTLNDNGTETIIGNLSPLKTQNGDLSVSVGSQSATFPMSYTPMLSAVEPSPVAAEATITLTGYLMNGRRQDYTTVNGSVTVDGKPCLGVSFSNNATFNLIQCTAPKGTGKNLPVQVTIDDEPSNIINTFTYLPPVITNFQQVDTIATIAGDNFGDDYTVVQVSYNGNTPVAATGIHLTRNSMIVPIPLDTLNGNVVIIVNGQPSAPFPLILAPIIQQASTLATLGGDLTLTGLFFNELDASGAKMDITVTKDHVLWCTNAVITVSNTEIVCQAPAGTGANITIELDIGLSFDDYQVSYAAPIISGVVVTSTDITVTGLNFGSVLSDIQLMLPNELGLTTAVPAKTLPTSDQVVTFTDLPEDVLSGDLFIQVSGQSSITTSYTLVPTIESIGLVSTEGGVVTIFGRHLTQKRSNSSFTDVQVMVSGQECSSVVVNQFTNITCTVQAGTGVANPTTVTIDGAVSNSYPLAYMKPTLTSWTQTDATFTVIGTNFGNVPAVASSTFGALTSQALSANQVQLTGYIPAFAQSGELFVTVDTQPSNAIDITLTPMIESITSTTTSGGPITILGNYLNAERQNKTGTVINVMFQLSSGSKECTLPAVLPPIDGYSALQCDAPAGTGNNIPVIVTIDGMSATDYFSYGAPVVSKVTVSETNQVTVTGTNFGTNPATVKVMLGSVSVTQFDLQDTVITFLAPLTSRNGMVIITVDDRASNGLSAILYPLLSTATKSDTQGSQVTVSGTYLNHFRSDNIPTNVTVAVDGQACTAVSWTVDDANLLCTAPAGTGVSHTLTLTIDDRSGSVALKYNAPSITGVTQQADIISIQGANFGKAVATSSLSNNYKIQSVVDDLVVAKIDPNARNNKFTITVDTQPSNDFQLNIQPLDIQTQPISPSGGMVTITGRYLNTLRSDSSSTEITVTVDGQACPVQTSASSTDGSLLVCSLGQGSFNQAVVSVTIDGKTGVGAFSSLSPTVTSSTQLFYLVGGDITVTGTNFIAPLTVTIGSNNVPCINAILVDQTSLICLFDASVQQVDAATKITVQVKAATQTSAPAAVLAYLQDQCPSGCSNNGICVSGFCQCNQGFSGSICDIRYDAQVVPSSISPVSAQFLSNISFSVAIESVRELSPTGSVVRTVQTSSMMWTQDGASVIDESYRQFTNRGVISAEDSFVMTVTSSWMLADNTTTFVGESLPNPANSIKHQIAMSGWKFASQENSLQLIYRASYPANLTQLDCKNVSVATTNYNSDITTSMKSLTVDSPYGLIVGNFPSRMIKDGVNRLLNVQLVPATGDDNNAAGSSVVVALNIPSFNKDVVVDPSFVSYSKTTPTQQTCHTGSSGGKSRSWVIPVAVVVPIVGVALIAGASVLVYKKMQNRRMENKMGRM
ncbi:hypothetical protein SAMD00019534_009080 [Acytostelium subglobosum LB1]|uniref:hypothetical protein n=1 Tax=Acytostelium subglobosum LB1 TaxID=1410327 RepID=UPI000644E343|nr:hypothetical protein SAMD00019534_009080 [Acytostelium subglobosum LB1]GAM17733.1 hypothetical protein SAMD00019534_009080 [Acytostelium subglobosum LB1]|eukprot:XP_012758329.1 hypothetical protein SAMD00019534_009080 [Acytostelium subglobosum LB1]